MDVDVVAADRPFDASYSTSAALAERDFSVEFVRYSSAASSFAAGAADAAGGSCLPVQSLAAS